MRQPLEVNILDFQFQILVSVASGKTILRAKRFFLIIKCHICLFYIKTELVPTSAFAVPVECFRFKLKNKVSRYILIKIFSSPLLHSPSRRVPWF